MDSLLADMPLYCLSMTRCKTALLQNLFLQSISKEMHIKFKIFCGPPGRGRPKIDMVDYVNGSSTHASQPLVGFIRPGVRISDPGSPVELCKINVHFFGEMQFGEILMKVNLLNSYLYCKTRAGRSPTFQDILTISVLGADVIHKYRECAYFFC